MAAIAVLERSEPEHQLALCHGEVLKQDIMLTMRNLTDTEESIEHERKQCFVHALDVRVFTHQVKIAEHERQRAY